MNKDWMNYQLGELVHVKHGFAFKGEHFSTEPTPDILVTPGNFAIGGGFKEDNLKYYSGPVPEDYVLQPGDLIITMTDLSKAGDTLGYPAIVPSAIKRRYLHNQRIGLVTVTQPTLLDSRYLFYRLRAADYRHRILATASGSTVRHTSPSRIQEFRTALPPLDDQRAIAGVLGALDDKIELNRRTSRTLEKLARAIFRAWFVDFEPVKAKAGGARSFPGMPQEAFDALPTRLVPSELGPIPEGWEVKTIGDIADVIDCLHAKKPERCDTGRPFLQLNNIRDDGLIDTGDTYHINEADYGKWVCRIEATKGDCVITNVGRVGAVAQIPEGLKAALGRNMTGIRCLPTYPFPTLLIECLLSDAMCAEITGKIDTGTILNALNVRNIPKLRFVLADRRSVAYFEQICRPLRQKMEQNLLESRKLATMRDYLLPKLLSGEVRVAEDSAGSILAPSGASRERKLAHE